MLVDGFDYQKGAIFGFRTFKDKETGKTLYKVTLTVRHLSYWMSEKRNVGMFKYEINRRGKENVHTASRKMILYGSVHKLKNGSNRFRKFPQSRLRNTRNKANIEWKDETVVKQRIHRKINAKYEVRVTEVKRSGVSKILVLFQSLF